MQKYCQRVSFEWSHHEISFTDVKVRILYVSITDSGSERFKLETCASVNKTVYSTVT